MDFLSESYFSCLVCLMVVFAIIGVIAMIAVCTGAVLDLTGLDHLWFGREF